MFDVSDMPLPYNDILGRPALAKFMAVAHYAYNTLNMPVEWGVLTVKADVRDAVFCVEQIYKAAVVSEPTAEPMGSREDEPGGSVPDGGYRYAYLPSGPKNVAAIVQRATQGMKRAIVQLRLPGRGQHPGRPRGKHPGREPREAFPGKRPA